MVAPESVWVPPSGVMLSTLALSSVEPVTLTWNPLFCNRVWAALNVMPTTFGTLTCCLPTDTQMVTAVPAETVVPESGLIRVTKPASNESEYSFSMVIWVSPACLSVSITASLDWPTRLSGIWVIPDDMYSVMIVPFVCFELAAGSVLTTLSLSIVALSTVLTLPTVNPADSRSDFASS